jgi:hypothetical protein
MRTRTLAILAVLAAAAVLAWAAVRPGAGAAPAARRQSLFAEDEIPVDRVDRLRVELPDGRAFEFVRAADGWAQSLPFAHPADPGAVREAAVLAASLVATRMADPAAMDPEARAALGLDPAMARLVISWPGGERAVELGRRTVSGRGWVRVAGQRDAASVDAALHALVLDGDLRQWRSLQVRGPGGPDVAEVEVRYGASPGQRMLLRRTAGRWAMEQPVPTRADGDAVRRYLDALERAEADGFVEDSPADLAAFGLAQPERGVRLAGAGGDAGGAGSAPVLAVDVGAEAAQGAPERFARIDGRPAVVLLGARALAAMFPPPASLIDPRGCDAVPADVRSVEFTAAAPEPGAAFTVTRNRDSWDLRLPGAEPAPADAQRVRRLLTQLCEARAPAVALQRMPEELVLGEFVLRGEGGAVLARVRVGHEHEGQWALDGGEGVLRVFPAGFDVATSAVSYAGSR